MAPSPPLLATYGTLMRSFDGVDHLDIGDRLTYVGRCRFAGTLLDLGRYPGAVPGNDVIHGDLVRLHNSNLWTVLDRYEGYQSSREEASLFLRRRIRLDHPPGQLAWIYWYNGSPTDHPLVPSGDWATYVHRDPS